jgi:hypothetical protein
LGAPFSAAATAMWLLGPASFTVCRLASFCFARFQNLSLADMASGIEVEPFDGFERRRVDAHFFHLGDEIEDVPAVLAFLKQFQMFFADADAELRRVAAFVDGTRAVQAVGTALELVHEAVVFQHLLHGDGRFDGLEVNEL